MQVFLNIIYFLLALTVLVSIHEAGHLSMAKLFNVYCDEYSIGFGPKIYQHKPSGTNKKGLPRETKFTIRALPLGGFVSMAGEGMEDVEELAKLPKERFLTGVAKWKRAIIMVAGVFLNAVLAIIILLIAYTIIPTVDFRATNFVVSENQLSYKEPNADKVSYDAPVFAAGITSKTQISKIEIIYNGEVTKAIKEKTNAEVYNKVYTIEAGTKSKVGGTYVFLTDEFNAYIPQDINDTKTYVFTLADGTTKTIETSAYISKITTDKKTSVEIKTYSWKAIGISTPTRARTAGEVITTAFRSFGDYSIAIYKALGQLFTKEGFNNLGGPIAIVQQQMTFSSNGIGYFLLFWGLISVNLAVINLLPFPGLDGWHFLVVIVEGITKKDINPKVKAIMSTIGMVLLFGLMIAITFKDIIKLFI